MKSRAFRSAGDGGDEGSKDRNQRNKKKNEKRLGGRGLSLVAFANTKSGPSGYNPSLIKKKRELYKNAKYVSKFKKTVKRESHHSMLEDVVENMDESKGWRKRKRNKKNSSLESIREEFVTEKAAAEKARREREAAAETKKEERERAEMRRKDFREKMFKKTRSGQPVMKYRIEHLLNGILQNPAN